MRGWNQVIREAGLTPSQGSQQEMEARPQKTQLMESISAEGGTGARVSSLGQNLLVDLNPLLLQALDCTPPASVGAGQSSLSIRLSERLKPITLL